MSWMRSEPSCHSNEPFYLRPATYNTMQNKKGRKNETKVLSLRVGELGCFYFVLYLNPKDSCYLASVAHTLCNQQVPVPLERLFDLSFIHKNSDGERWSCRFSFSLTMNFCAYIVSVVCFSCIHHWITGAVFLERLTQMHVGFLFFWV